MVIGSITAAVEACLAVVVVSALDQSCDQQFDVGIVLAHLQAAVRDGLIACQVPVLELS